jgi:hypothetical protein
LGQHLHALFAIKIGKSKRRAKQKPATAMAIMITMSIKMNSSLQRANKQLGIPLQHYSTFFCDCFFNFSSYAWAYKTLLFIYTIERK